MAVTRRFGARSVTKSMVAGDRRCRLSEIEARVWCRMSAWCQCLAEDWEGLVEEEEDWWKRTGVSCQSGKHKLVQTRFLEGHILGSEGVCGIWVCR